MRPALADHLRKFTLGIAELLTESLVALSLLERIEIGALYVLDDRDFERLLVVGLNGDDRHIVQFGAVAPPASGAPQRRSRRHRRHPARSARESAG